MRTILAILALAGLACGAARAGDLTDPVWLTAPDRSDWAKAYPAEAAQKGLEGAASVRCSATAAGSLENCAVISETPTGQGFGAAALSLTGGMAMRPTSQSGEQVVGKSVLVPIRFVPDVLQPHGVITDPEWVHTPDGDDFSRYWPAQAVDGGRAVVNCVVTNRGLMDRCRVKDETPADVDLAGPPY